ncbi:MAG: bifunctional diaminohydroxyphosphoribosylaminopyrimidine deaminase/5-amino-6-(5-phosphoribosylamino)uracil reductase RibD [Candidatus Marinimicrobia bacterium]|nr:bifunctional diaminohydroxyphosphoribosylaminopyrimidine deaminase/5-amino-6-(5-phosphoribosylamino)uracil reductase RibD [Candidatus Neomarinimicrobiota bacterium]MBT3681743.1 bifunctional diaminohydroxyphosphoribosylaminopyrimidine deaminase/5-amino-6-(5-phosphoribosylamino)uracil reductase RibD [Candidatus Neomarinimicrobiota bacterium]MBT3759469.1 bifunctional diaminohydroxyphosphoribosylaminopyrimidine deaminase/5-amino-6-(5-phosphoribosylamino)uracil reductase RibD [Candidatus Neomarinim
MISHCITSVITHEIILKFYALFKGLFAKMDTHRRFMQRALNISRLGRSSVSPNPIVGCVIVKNNKIIGEGYHNQFGGPHAEVLAVRNSTESVCGATAYVTLEPCNQSGKTPPCLRLLIESNIEKVVIGIKDPNPMMSHSGIDQLKAAGIQTDLGILKTEIQYANRGFLKWIQYGLPWVIVKIAQSDNGLISINRHERTMITGELVKSEVHSLRAEVDAVLIGRQTAMTDDPRLTVRNVEGKNPIRYVADTHGKLPGNLKIFRDDEAETRVFVSSKVSDSTVSSYCQNIAVDTTNKGLVPLEMLVSMAKDGITSVLIEGGAQLVNSFLKENLVDELLLYTATALTLPGNVKNPFHFNNKWDKKEERIVGPDRFERFQIKKAYVHRNS